MSYLKNCPRCTERSYEVLKTHAYCMNCNFSFDVMYRGRVSVDDLSIPVWVAKIAREPRSLSSNNLISIEASKGKYTDSDGDAA